MTAPKINKKATIIALFMLCTAIGFWSISRYPQLNMKKDVIERGNLSDSKVIQGKITHTIRYSESSTLTAWENIEATTLNWIFANWRGMSFGVAIGAAFLSFLKSVSFNLGGNRFLNSLYGMITGIPLGVCSNCVSPVMKGTFEGKRKMEYSLATMFSSPMLNIVVLTILFSTFPLQLAIANTIAVLILVLVITPLFAHKRAKKYEEAAVCEINSSAVCAIEKNTWGYAIKSAATLYLKDLFFLFIRVVPLMFLAGFLGAITINLLSPAEFFSNSSISPLMLVPIAALFAALLPMPIAIDLMLAQSLLVAGVPLPIIAVFIFALGSYSIYSFMIVKQTFSWKVAIEIYIIIVAIATILGLATLSTI